MAKCVGIRHSGKGLVERSSSRGRAFFVTVSEVVESVRPYPTSTATPVRIDPNKTSPVAGIYADVVNRRLRRCLASKPGCGLGKRAPKAICRRTEKTAMRPSSMQMRLSWFIRSGSRRKQTEADGGNPPVDMRGSRLRHAANLEIAACRKR